jgi:hypothetical protein
LLDCSDDHVQARTSKGGFPVGEVAKPLAPESGMRRPDSWNASEDVLPRDHKAF